MSTGGNSSFTGPLNEASMSHAEATEQRASEAESASTPRAQAADAEMEASMVAQVAREEQDAVQRLAQRLAEDRMSDAEYRRLTAVLRQCTEGPLRGADDVPALAGRTGAASPSSALPPQGWENRALHKLLAAPDMSEEDWAERRRARHRGVGDRHRTDEGKLADGDISRSRSASFPSSLWSSNSPMENDAERGMHTYKCRTDEAGQGASKSGPQPRLLLDEESDEPARALPETALGHRTRTQRPPPLLPCEGHGALRLAEPPSLTETLRHAAAAAPVRAEATAAETPLRTSPQEASLGKGGRKCLRLNLGSGTTSKPQDSGSPSGGTGRTFSLAVHPVAVAGSSKGGGAPAPASGGAAPASQPRRVFSLAAPVAPALHSTSTQAESVATLSTTGPYQSPRGGGPGGAGGEINVISSPFSPGTPGWPGMTPTGGAAGELTAFPAFAHTTNSHSHVSREDEDDLLGTNTPPLRKRSREEGQSDAPPGAPIAEEVTAQTPEKPTVPVAPGLPSAPPGLSPSSRANHGGAAEGVVAVKGPHRKGGGDHVVVVAASASARSPLSPTSHATIDSESRYGSLTPTPAVYGNVPTRQHSRAGVPLPTAPVPIRFDTVKVHVQDHYVFHKKISEGTYGEVYVGVDKRNNEMVALKRLKTLKALDGFPRTSLREVIALKHIEQQRDRLRAASHSTADPLPEVITLREVLLSAAEPATNASDEEAESHRDGAPPSTRVTHDIYLVFSYASCSLAGLLEKRFAFNILELTFIFHKIILGVRKLHEMGIIHRDIKADNILITDTGAVQLADFGLCAFVSSGKRALTPSMINLSYRPPEMLLGSNAYDERVDVWSIGCLLAQVFLGVPPFFKRRNAAEQAAVQQHNRSAQTELEQLSLICEVLGPLPPEGVFDPEACRHLEDVRKLQIAFEASGGTATAALQPIFTKSFLFDRYKGFRSWFTARVEERRRQLERVPGDQHRLVLMPTGSCTDALTRIFQLDPKKRPTAAELLKLDFFRFVSSHEENRIRDTLAKRLEPFHGSHIAPR